MGGACKWGPIDYVEPDDLKIISRPIDFLGLNFYTRHVAKAGQEQKTPKAPVTDMGWEITPWALHDLLVRIKRDFTDLPIYITENGAAFKDVVNASGEVDDLDRVAYLREHLKATYRAIQDGVDVRGYFVWSLMDNFEWAWGYSKRFGIVYVDYKTLQRIPKRSAYWYREVIRRNGLEDEG